MRSKYPFLRKWTSGFVVDDEFMASLIPLFIGCGLLWYYHGWQTSVAVFFLAIYVKSSSKKG